MAGLNEKQLKAFEISLKGHNTVICGQAGTGKSYVLRQIVHALQASGRKVAVTATTGIASQQFSQLGATTLHSWAGLHDGRFNCWELSRLLKEDEKFKDAAKRIRETNCLVVDEMSMLSAKVFDLLEGVTRNVRHSNEYFGGIQLILAGDFYQLPPVKNALQQEEGKFCFTSSLWKKAFPHTVELTEALRQDEKELVQAVNEAARGFLSMESRQLLANLKRPIHAPPDQTVVKLFATNQQVDVENTSCVIEMPGEIKTYQSEDEGDNKYLRNVLASKTLHLKKNCPVMLLRNLSKDLVNGSMGRVVDFGECGPIVHFMDANKTLEVKAIPFSVYNQQLRINIAVRTQIPLKAAFAVTIHKSQGMTLPYVAIDCHMINRPGQLGVAVGRAKSIHGMQILHFNHNCCIPQLDCVEDFYYHLRRTDTCVADNLSCCNQAEFVELVENVPNVVVVPPDVMDVEQIVEGDLDEHEITDDELRELDLTLEQEVQTDVAYELPEGYDIGVLLSKVKFTPDHEPLEYHRTVNHILTEWEKDEKFKLFLSWELQKIHDIVTKYLSPGEKAAQREQSAIMTEYTRFTRSEEHKKKCEYVAGSKHPSDFHYCAISRVMNELRLRELNQMANSMPCPPKEKSVVRRLPGVEDLTDGARGKIRYVGGYCLAHTRYQYQQQTNRLVFRLDSVSRTRMMQAHKKVILLSSLMMTESQAQSFSQDKASLHATSRKQNLSQGLSHIVDSVNLFFMDLCREVISLQSATNLNVYGERLNHFVLDSVSQKDELFSSFSSLFVDSEHDDTELIKRIFLDIVALFCRVMLKQFRKDFLASMKKKKGMAHRKKVLIGSGSKGKTACVASTSTASVFGFSDILSDESREKSESHSRLTNLANKNELIKRFKKSDLQTLSTAYELNYKSRDSSKILSDQLKVRIVSSSAIHKPDILGSVSPSLPSGRRHTSRARQDDLENTCRECQQKHQGDEEEDEWIQCDGQCRRWFHRDCADLFDDDEWDDYLKNGVKFFCLYCPTS